MDRYIASIAARERYGFRYPIDSNTIQATQTSAQLAGDAEMMEVHSTMPLRATIALGPDHETRQETNAGAGLITEANLRIDTPHPSPGSQIQPEVRETRQNGRNRPIICPTCNKTFNRTDVLRRHQHEQHNQARELFLCPHDPCKKSKQGSGFKRQGQLNRHLVTCKTLKRKTMQLNAIDKSGPTRLEILPAPVDESQDVPLVSHESEERLDEDNGLACSSGGCDLASELRKRRELEQAELERLDQERDRLDQEREKRKQKIAIIDQLINHLD